MLLLFPIVPAPDQLLSLWKVGEEMPGFTPTFGGGMPQGAVQRRCLWKVGEKMPGFAPTFGGGWIPPSAVVGSGVAWLMTLEKGQTEKGQIALTRCWSRMVTRLVV